MNVDPKIMDEQLASQGRYQKKAAPATPQFVFEEEGFDGGDDYKEIEYAQPQAPQQRPPIRQYNNPIHEQDAEVEGCPGLYESQLTSWKKQYGKVFFLEVKDQPFVFRKLERFEYKEIVGQPNTDPLMREELIAECCVLYPLAYDFTVMANQSAGYPAVLSEVIMDFSGFTRDIKVREL